MKILSLSALALVASLGGCSGAPVRHMQSTQPNGSANGYAIVHSPLLDETSHRLTHLNENKDIVYFQTFGGGGATLGALLGPIGVLANQAMIESATKDDKAKLANRLDLQPASIFADVARDRGLLLNAIAGNNRLSPYLYIVKLEDNTLLVAAAAIVEQQTAAGKWTGKYMVQFPLSYSMDQLSSADASTLAELRRQAAVGYGKIIDQLRSENPGSSASETRVTFHSPFITPRTTLTLQATLASEDKDLLWLRTNGGLYGLRKSTTTITRL